jgi:sulfite exporter TauE/SafE
MGAASMGAFWLGTLPALALAASAVRRLAQRSPWARRGLAAMVFAAGAWAVHTRTPAPDAPSDVPPCHAGAAAHP